MCIYIQYYADAVSFLKNASAQPRSNEAEGVKCFKYCCNFECCKCCMSLVATLLDKQSAKLKKVKKHNIKSICGQ